MGRKDIAFYLKRKGLVDEFTQRVVRLLISIKRGRVATYGQIAELAGRPERSRQVGFILRNVIDADKVPWHRVIGSAGKISFPKRNKNHKIQRRRLENEGILFEGERIDLKRFRWKRRGSQNTAHAKPHMFRW